MCILCLTEILLIRYKRMFQNELLVDYNMSIVSNSGSNYIFSSRNRIVHVKGRKINRNNQSTNNVECCILLFYFISDDILTFLNYEMVALVCNRVTSSHSVLNAVDTSSFYCYVEGRSEMSTKQHYFASNVPRNWL